MSYIIGSFNLRDFNYSNSSNDGIDEKLNRNFDKIAKIILNEKFDVIALQEINAPSALNHLVSKLNLNKNLYREYSCSFGEYMPFQNTVKDPERYGFIWNTKRLRLINVKGKNPTYYQNAGASQLIRPPYVGRFTARGMLGGSNFELRLVNTHIKFGNTMSERFFELNILLRQILPRICDHQEVSEDGELMPAYTILAGDYNLEFNSDEITSTNYTGKYRKFITTQNELSSLKIPGEYSNIEECYSKNYDHFSYELGKGKGLDTKLKLVSQRIEALSKYFSKEITPTEKLANYREQISDHVPIKMIIDLKR